MKQYIHILTLLFCFTLVCVSGYGQDIVGLSYGTPYEQAYKHLKKKFGKPCYTEGKDLIGFSDIKEGKISFMFTDFHFIKQENNFVFNGVSFLSNYKNYEEAFELYSTICKILSDKYKNGRIDFQTEGMGDNFFMKCEFGTHPIHKDQYFGKITLHRGKNKDGKKFYYVNLKCSNL